MRLLHVLQQTANVMLKYTARNTATYRNNDVENDKQNFDQLPTESNSHDVTLS